MVGVNQTKLEEKRRHDERAQKDIQRLKPFQQFSLDEAALRARVRPSAESGSGGTINMDATNTGGDPVGQLEALITAHRLRDPKSSYADAFRSAAKERPDLAELARVAVTRRVGPGGVPLAPPATGTATAVERFDALVTDHRAANPGMTYADAFVAMAASHPDLVEKRRAEFAGVVTL
jgi:hypothetical protein